MKTTALRAACFIVLAGCVTPGKLDTPSGRPEVTIKGASPDDVANACAARVAREGWILERSDRFSVVAAGRTNNVLADAFFGSSYDRETWFRLTFSIVQQAGAVTVYGRWDIVTNRGSAFERISPMDQQKHYEETQRILEEIKASVTSTAAPVSK